jgi:hypothetical protein
MINIRDPALKESVKETRQAEMFLVEIVDTAEALIGCDPRSRSDFAQSTTEGTDHKAFADQTLLISSWLIRT